MIKVELPTVEAERLLEQWQRRAEDLEGQLSELKHSISSVEAQLSGRLPSMSVVKQLDKSVEESKKTKKGQNLRVVQSFLGGLNGRGVTVAELSKGTSVGSSSVYLVLTRHKEIFAKGNDGLWRIKGTQ